MRKQREPTRDLPIGHDRMNTIRFESRAKMMTFWVPKAILFGVRKMVTGMLRPLLLRYQVFRSLQWLPTVPTSIGTGPSHVRGDDIANKASLVTGLEQAWPLGLEGSPHPPAGSTAG